MPSYPAPGGPRLADFLDGLQVEKRWLPGHPVVWQTGQQDGPDEPNPAHHTHCSAFAAAAALYLDIYVLRPPHHGQIQLANAQTGWLAGNPSFSGPAAAASGWLGLGLSGAVDVLITAQMAANSGQLVLACYAATAPTPGHVAIVRPQHHAGGAPPADGPDVISAGEQNYNSVSMKTAFSAHPEAWPNNIALFVCDTPLQHDVTGC
jgi:hypothetical protein